jgi:predicted ArsR family transcriptional regulator
MSDETLGPILRLSDPAALRVYAHPVRLRLVGLLRQHETLTATQAAKLLGESSGSCSFHLRALAKHGLVEEVPAPGRAKPWKATAQATAWETSPDDPAASEAGRILSTAVVDLHAETARKWVQERELDPAGAWSQAAWISDRLLVCTAEELTALRAQIGELLEPFIRRAAGPRSTGERLVDFISFAVPMPDAGG